MEQRDDLVLVDGEPVAVRLLLERLVDTLLPVDEGAVDVEGHEVDLLGEGHRGRECWAPPPLMDLLEYQGKQLFARHGVPVPEGQPAATVDEALAAADAIGYPCVVKAQVLIGGRGKAGGIKVAKDRDEARDHAEAILGMDIKGHTVSELWIEQASDIAEEYYASIVFDRSAKAPLFMLSTHGGMDIEEVAAKDPR